MVMTRTGAKLSCSDASHGTVCATCRLRDFRRHRMRTVRLAPTTSNTTTTIILPAATRMASTLFRRQLARAPRLSSISPSQLGSSSSLLSAARRHLSRSAAAQADVTDAATTRSGKNVFDTHTVEDLHGMHATEILAETASRPEAQLRHFTGAYNPLLLSS